ncbi:MAG: amidase family protein [Alphaproteobacteria bacterium]|nr:amidase family protein [Alphaproteobacteria bacterium]
MTDTSELWRLSAADLSAKIRSGAITAEAATESALDRLAAVNPKLNAVVQEMPDEARAAAKRIDQAVAQGENPGCLAGVPVTVKVNVDQMGHATTNGLTIQKELVAQQDSPVVSNLRKAGAVIIGRTNTPAFSLRWFTKNNLHGVTKNPRDPGLTPGGSSGGAASAVAAGICALGHGTDIAGSIRYPAYACGIHGLRPSIGRVPAVNFTAPDRYIGAQLMAVSGPIARTIKDLELGFKAMSAPDNRDSWYVPEPAVLPKLPKRAVLASAPEGTKVHPDVTAALLKAADQLSNAGWDVIEGPCPPLRTAVKAQLILWLSEFKRGALAALHKEDEADSQFIYAQLERHGGVPDFNSVMDALQLRTKLAREWQMFLQDTPIVILPVSTEPAFPDQLDVSSPEGFDRVFEAQLTQVALPFFGMPAMTVSTGLSGTAPVGVQLVAPRYREDLLFEVGTLVEQGGVPASPVDP